MEDYLGEIAENERQLKVLIKEQKYDEAWRLTHLISDLQFKHINSSYSGNSPEVVSWANCFANSMSEYRADILSKEGKHIDALIQAIWKAATEHRPIKKYESKMKVYLKKTEIDMSEKELMGIFDRARQHNDFGKLRAEFEVYLDS